MFEKIRTENLLYLGMSHGAGLSLNLTLFSKLREINSTFMFKKVFFG
jgi:hypothetical protein